MITYKQLLILRLSNLTEWKNENEMLIPEEMRGDFDWAETCEFLGDGRYILREYWKNGWLGWKTEYQNGQRHGKDIYWWWKNGNKRWEREYQNDQRHGKDIYWWENGNKLWETEYQNGQLHGRSFGWRESGIKHLENEYQNGKLIKRHL